MMMRRTIALIALCFAYLEVTFDLSHDTISRMVIDERDRQDTYWGGYDHDKQHDAREWTFLFMRQIGKIAAEFVP